MPHSGAVFSLQLIEEQDMPAATEGARRAIHHSLLSCIAGLERFYSSLRRPRTDAFVVMRDEAGRAVPILAKNMAKFRELTPTPFPEGEIDLRGAGGRSGRVGSSSRR
jgi:hypothetical protein